jgi:hypothetical protein
VQVERYTAPLMSRRVFAGLGMSLVLSMGLAVLVSVWPIPQEVSTSILEAVEGRTAASVNVTWPAWLRSGSTAQVKMEITRLGQEDTASSGRAWVARLSSTDLEVMPSEEQAASMTGLGETWRFAWNVLARRQDAGSTLSLSQRSYEDGGIVDTILLARFLTFEVRRPLLSPGLGVLGLAAGVGCLILARRGGG